MTGPAVLADAEVDAELAERGLQWVREGDRLVQVTVLDDFAAALAWVNVVGALAERAGHHPDISLRWGTVTLELSTHSAGGITRSDLDLAAALDALRPVPGD